MVTAKKPIIAEQEYQASLSLRTSPMPEWIETQLAKPEQEWLLRDVIMPGGLTVVAGRPKLGKSFLSMVMAMAMSSGKNIGPFKPVGRTRSLYLDLEGVERQTALRCELLRRGLDLEPRHLSNIQVAEDRSFQILEPGRAASLTATIREHGTQVVFLDTFARTFQGDENAKKDVQHFLDTLSEIRSATGVAFVLVHHVNKAQLQYKDTAVFMDPDGGLRGSSALAGAYDVILSLQDGWNDGEHINAILSKGKYTSEWWMDYCVEGEKAMADDGEEEFTQSWITFGRRRNELGLWERAPSDSQPNFRKRDE